MPVKKVTASPKVTRPPAKPKSDSFARRSLIGIIYTIVSACVIIGGTYIAVRWARGDFRLDQVDPLNPTLARETGLLSVTSTPQKASVYINDRFVTATDDVLYLAPGEYNVKIIKDGYATWEKNLTISRSLVTSTDALLIPSSPSLTALTFTGAQNLSVSPDGLKIIYYTASTSATTKNGLYLLDINATGFTSSPKLPVQITDDAPQFDLANAEIIWSANSNQFLLKTASGTFLLSAYSLSPLESQPDVTFRANQIIADWESEMVLRERQFLARYPDEVLELITDSAKNVYLSPDKKKLLYTATASAVLPEHILEGVISQNSQPQTRTLVAGGVYVYDLEEDTNFALGQEKVIAAEETSPYLTKQLITSDFASPSAYLNQLIVPDDLLQTADNFKVYHSSLYADTYQWLSDSRHLARIRDGQVMIVSYDNTNPVLLYSGHLGENFLYPWPDSSKLLILTSFATGSLDNIYAIEIKK
ncbi:PEGA domain-containing protein [Microgenomates group bacterium]|nr:PEGA domain-containing protein [Microgenomates group bacterium]